jgi:hypothetical protein
MARKYKYTMRKKGGSKLSPSIIPPMISTVSGGTPQQIANQRVLDMAKEHTEMINQNGGGDSTSNTQYIVPQMNTGMSSNPMDGNHLAIKGAGTLLQTHENGIYDSELYSKPIKVGGRRKRSYKVNKKLNNKNKKNKSKRVNRKRNSMKRKLNRRKNRYSKRNTLRNKRKHRRHRSSIKVIKLK